MITRRLVVPGATLLLGCSSLIGVLLLVAACSASSDPSTNGSSSSSGSSGSSGSSSSSGSSGSSGSNSSTDYGKTCTKEEDCSDICILSSFGSKGRGMCTHACATAAECPSGVLCEQLDSSPKTVCVPKTPCTAGDPSSSEECKEIDSSK